MEEEEEEGESIQAVGGGGGGGGGVEGGGREGQRQGLGIPPCLVRSLLCTGLVPCCMVGLSVATTGRERREGARVGWLSVPSW